MTFQGWVQESIARILDSPILHGAVTGGIILLAIFGVLAVVVGTTFLLRRYFKRHPFINRAHRIGVYLLTMTGVLILLVGAALGALLPVIPGILFLLLALLLLRKYYRNRWVETKIRYLRFKLRIKRAIRRRLHHHAHASSPPESLRTRPGRGRSKK